MTERRYNEDEVATIFANASETADAARRTNASAGLTLAELQEIGGEVGLSPDAVAHAAAQLNPATTAVSRQTAQVTRRLFWLPISVAGAVELPRKLTDAEWDHLVSNLRSTFDARGRTLIDGARREWRNGNLRARLDRTADGEQFTIKTTKGSAIPLLWSGLLALVSSAVFFSPLIVEAATDDNFFLRGSFVLLAAGIGLFATAARSLPAWARTRRLQIDNVITRLLTK